MEKDSLIAEAKDMHFVCPLHGRKREDGHTPALCLAHDLAVVLEVSTKEWQDELLARDKSYTELSAAAEEEIKTLRQRVAELMTFLCHEGVCPTNGFSDVPVEPHDCLFKGSNDPSP